MERGEKELFSVETGRETVDSFAYTSGVPCRLYGCAETVLCQQEGERAGCSTCLRAAAQSQDCQRLHRDAIAQSERFGGRYIYFCPSGMAFFASPIMMGGKKVGALVGGPVLIMGVEDYLDPEHLTQANIRPEDTEQLRRALERVAQMEPARLNHLSNQLFADAVYLSDTGHELFLTQRESRQQNTIGAYIQQLKSAGSAVYPVEAEQELAGAIIHGDVGNAARLLNELLGYILFSTGSFEQIQTHMIELLVVISRAAVYAGGDSGLIFPISRRAMGELMHLTAQEDMALRLAEMLHRLMALVFSTEDSKHRNAIRKAAAYLQLNCGSKVTLSQVAAYVGYSPAYFSKVFKEELGMTFRGYLNQLRVEKSKALLLRGEASLAEVCALVGFEDQSYFGKVFKQFTGVTPDKYRKRQRRIDSEKEHGLREG